jgi:hypothetical protein
MMTTDNLPGSDSMPDVDRITAAVPMPRAVRGKALILGLSVVVAAFLTLNIVSARKNQRDARSQRGSAELLANPDRVTQKWTTQADGLVVRYTAVDRSDSAVVKRIRTYLQGERTQHLRADYSDIRFGQKTLPGRADLEYATENMKLNVRYFDEEAGGRLQWITTDPIAKQALAEWSAAVQDFSSDR